jgi:hypothetical protein
MKTGAFATDLPPSSVYTPLLQSKDVLTALHELISTAPDPYIHEERRANIHKRCKKDM